MAILANTFDTYTTVGGREDLLDAIYMITPEETVFLSNIGVGPRATATKVEWQTDILKAVDTTSQPEGNEYAIQAITPTVRLDNQCQILTRTFSVTRTQEAIRKAGRRSEGAKQLAMRTAELKRDLESVFVGVNEAKVATDPRNCASLSAYVAQNDSFGTGGASPAGANGSAARTDGTQRAFTETLLKSVLALVWNEGGNVDMVMVGSFNKQAASAFTGIAQIRVQVPTGARATIVGAADVYKSDFGDVTFVPNRLQRARDAWVLDSDLLAARYLRPFDVDDIAHTGDVAAKKAVNVEATLQVSQEKGLGLIADINTV